jgi:hypothetical protein
MRPSHEIRARRTSPYALNALQALPCGCVAAVYRTEPLAIQIVALEARGPHCIYAQHQTGRVLGVGGDEDTGSAVADHR